MMEQTCHDGTPFFKRTSLDFFMNTSSHSEGCRMRTCVLCGCNCTRNTTPSFANIGHGPKWLSKLGATFSLPNWTVNPNELPNTKVEPSGIQVISPFLSHPCSHQMPPDICNSNQSWNCLAYLCRNRRNIWGLTKGQLHSGPDFPSQYEQATK